MNISELFGNEAYTIGLLSGGVFVLFYQLFISLINSCVNFLESKFFDTTLKRLKIKNLDLQNKLLAAELEEESDILG